MTMAEQFIGGVEARSGNFTRRYLERLPQDKWTWKPHEKSMTLGGLASHLAEINGWVEVTINETEMKFDPETWKPYLAESPAEAGGHARQGPRLRGKGAHRCARCGSRRHVEP